MDPETEGRLKKGAALLGELWRAGERCARGWDLEVTTIPDDMSSEEAVGGWACQCPAPNRFCKAKRHWLKLALLELRDPIDGPFGLGSMMNGEEWDLTGLTRKVDFPGVGIVPVGANGVILAADLEKLKEAPESLDSLVKLLKAFPKARIVAVHQPAPPAAAPEPPPKEEPEEESPFSDDLAEAEAE